jgi:hypothetical protein
MKFPIKGGVGMGIFTQTAKRAVPVSFERPAAPTVMGRQLITEFQ